MSITSSGAKCDVCGDYILPIKGDEQIYPFKLTAIKEPLDACGKCIEFVKSIDKNQGGDGDWTKLPDGPVRRAFEEATV